LIRQHESKGLKCFHYSRKLYWVWWFCSPSWFWHDVLLSICIEFYAREFLNQSCLRVLSQWWLTYWQKENLITAIQIASLRENGQAVVRWGLPIFWVQMYGTEQNKCRHFKAFTSQTTWTGWVWCQSRSDVVVVPIQQSKELVVHEIR
jgi:hypothetical protein